jgi:hypothetical protein
MLFSRTFNDFSEHLCCKLVGGSRDGQHICTIANDLSCHSRVRKGCPVVVATQSRPEISMLNKYVTALSGISAFDSCNAKVSESDGRVEFGGGQ